MILLAAVALAFVASPFVHATGPFAGFEKARAIPAGIIGIAGTAVITVWGWLLLRDKGRGDPGQS